MSETSAAQRLRRRKALPGFPIPPHDMSDEEIRKYFGNDKVECLLCGRRFLRLGQHLSIHEITDEQYKIRYGLPFGSSLLSYDERIRHGEIAGRDNAFMDDMRTLASPPTTHRTSAVQRRKTAILAATLDVRGSNNPRAILSSEDVEMIRSSDRPSKELAKEFGVSQATIRDVKTRTWRCVESPAHLPEARTVKR